VAGPAWRPPRADAELLGASQVATVAADVADAAQVEAAAAMLEAELGPPDVWVNNAMTSAFAPAWEITAEEYRRMAEVIYLGYVHGTLAALARMRPRDRARSARRWPTAGSRCRLPTAPPSTPSRASTTRSAPTCTTPAAGSG
jgi:NAD(P)-dependent dehydrogenase (short-subunit alcohol dehydrogenase family)